LSGILIKLIDNPVTHWYKFKNTFISCCYILNRLVVYFLSTASPDYNIECWCLYITYLNFGALFCEYSIFIFIFYRIKKVWVARNPPGFAFVEFEDPRDAEDAIAGMNGQ